jgi:hypothetical protein
MGVWEDQGKFDREGFVEKVTQSASQSTQSAYGCGCDPGYRTLNKNIGYLCKHHPDCTYGREQRILANVLTSRPGPIDMSALDKSLPEGISGAVRDAQRAAAFFGVMTTTDEDVEQAVFSDATERKQRPLATGCLDYFPDALMEVAYCSWKGNEQHNPGQSLHWAREKSTDEPDALLRHLKDRGTLDTDGVRHSAKVAWRALALLQKEIEAERVR